MASKINQLKEQIAWKKAGIVMKDYGEKQSGADDINWETPADTAKPSFVMCQPFFVDNKVANNVWIKKLQGDEAKIDKMKFMAEWFNLYHILATDAIVYLLPAQKGLQDATFVNCFAYLPHVEEKTIILSNFTAEGRAGEEEVAGRLLTDMGYKCVKPPYKFEGDAEIKYLRDDIYFGGYGIRTDKKFYDWLEEKYGGNIIRLNSQDEYLYHLDCLLFVLDKETVMACTEIMKKEEIKAIEKVAEIHPVTHDDAMECVCNSIKLDDMIVNSSDLEFLQKRDPDYKKEYKKNEHLEKICSKLGYEITYTPMTEAGKSGAALSCFVGILKHIR